MSVVVCNPPGSKLGNATMSWLHAYAHAQRVGAEFLCGPWIGEEVWNLPKYGRPTAEQMKLPECSEINLRDDETDVVIRGYAQNQRAMIYTKSQAQEWLKPRYSLPQIFGERLDHLEVTLRGSFIAHRRAGDYFGYGYPVVSSRSVDRGIERFGFSPNNVYVCTEEHPTPCAVEIPGQIRCIGDFYRMVHAHCLWRGNSSFSWVAGLLSNGRVFSPVIDGLSGGREHDVEFIEGNWPRLSNLEGCGELHVRP